MLRRLLKANGEDLGVEDAAIQDLNDWFHANVEAGPHQPGSLLPAWYSVVHDVAVFLGEVMIGRHPNLRWEFFTWGKTDVAYQRHVIMGFSTEDPQAPYQHRHRTVGRDLCAPNRRGQGVHPHLWNGRHPRRTD